MKCAGDPHTTQMACILSTNSASDEQRRHRPERPAHEVLIEAGDDHAHAAIGERGGELDQPVVEELRLVDAHHLHVAAERGRELAAVAHGVRRHLAQVARHHALGTMTAVGGGLEHLDLLAGDDGAADASQELFALAARTSRR